ncbi:MAG: hypothetical protein KDA17_00570 [Candidatus Saccharibacteria bacterium]|nr:hypothetical protein [Candidatus Saccharibacteria bacterium]
MTYSAGNGRQYEFAVEDFTDAVPAMVDILKRNHEELSSFSKAFDPDFRRYLYIDSQGCLSFISIRYEGEIVGYSLFFIDESIQQKGEKSATQSLLFIDKGHRGIGLAFLRFCDDTFKKMGVNSIWRQSKEEKDVSAVYLRMGYELNEKVFLKRL